MSVFDIRLDRKKLQLPAHTHTHTLQMLGNKRHLKSW